MSPEKILREEAQGAERLLFPGRADTTSEPRTGNGPPGAPVKASMSGFVSQSNQGGTVEYSDFVSHPCFFRGWGFLFTCPITGEMQNAKCKMQN